LSAAATGPSIRAQTADRSQLSGLRAISIALDSREDVRLIMLRSDDASEEASALAARAAERGVRIWRCGEGDMRRLGRGPDAQRALALLGPPTTATLSELLARGGVSWLLHRALYPSNVGFAVRTAEVSGADGVIVDATFNHEQRARVEHVSMGAARMLPVLYHDSEQVLHVADAQRVRVVCLEDVGSKPPWDVDLGGPLLCLIGSERAGISKALLDRCDAVVRIPMAGFVPSYNVQAAMAAIAIERLRQLGAAG
jgi:23S rRNA (guanosine2251-2'-O)-methyltransferase